MTEWFEQWFGEEYLRLYPHRDDLDAQRAIGLVDRMTNLQGSRVLDLACGPGRHAVQLGLRGARVVGFDLSMPLLSRAKHGRPPVRQLVRGDMRCLPFRASSFDVVVNLFTSFGYFARDEQHSQVLSQAATVLGPNGTFVLDYLNVALVRDALVPHEERTVGTQTVAIKRRISDDGRFVEKEMHLVDDGRSFLERVRLFSSGDLTAMMAEAGLAVRELFGDYDGGPLIPSAPRAILVARRL